LSKDIVSKREIKMRKIMSAFILPVLALVTLMGAWSGFGEGKEEKVFARINKEALENGRGAETLKMATTAIGHRLTGSTNGKKAEEFAFDLFKKYGYDQVAFKEFQVEAWSRVNAHLNLYYGSSDTLSAHPSATNQTLPPKLSTNSAGCVYAPEVVSLAHSPVHSDIFKKVIDIGNGLKSDFEKQKDSIRGHIVLLNIGIYPADSMLKNLHRSEKTALAIQYGASGCIFINNVKGRILLTGTASIDGQLIPIPAVCITEEDGLSIRQCLKLNKKAYARIILNNKSGPIKARNVEATLKGSSLPEEEIILCGHLDSWDLATGAIDNGIGSFTVMEIARIFKKLDLKPKRTIRFITFMGEEQGLLGSRFLVSQMKADGSLNRLRYVINLDMSGNTQGFNASGRPEMEAFIKKVMQEMQEVDPGFKASFANNAGLHSDHQPFMLEGIPVLGSEGSLDPEVYKYYHSNKDDFSLVNSDHMKRCARFVGMMLYALADAKEIPAKKLDEEETRDFFIKAKLKEELILGKDWRWGE
jgi:carboxypeptidase Q